MNTFKYVASLLAFATLGCLPRVGKEGDYPIEGTVCTSRTPIDLSYRLVGSGDLPNGYDPISDADVSLSFDKEGRSPVVGFNARTDAKGRYTIPLKGIPPSPTEYGNRYYFRVVKAGYEPFVRQIGIGPLSDDLRNVVVLKPTK